MIYYILYTVNSGVEQSTGHWELGYCGNCIGEGPPSALNGQYTLGRLAVCPTLFFALFGSSGQQLLHFYTLSPSTSVAFGAFILASTNSSLPSFVQDDHSRSLLYVWKGDWKQMGKLLESVASRLLRRVSIFQLHTKFAPDLKFGLFFETLTSSNISIDLGTLLTNWV